LPEKAIHNPESAELYLSLQQRACVQDLYDAEIFEADRGFSGFVDVLRETGRYEGAFILLVADHGESFGEHGTYFHGGNLNQEELRVPLIIRLPGGQHGGHRVEELVSLVDIFPTVLEWTGSEIENNYPLAGMVLPLDEVDATRLRGRPIFAELAHDYGRTFDLVCVIDEFGHKRVLDLSGVSNGTARSESVGLWDTMSDPLEESDLSGTRSVHAAYGKQLIGEFLARQEQWRRSSGVLAPRRAELSEEAREKLKALGYLR
jgi:arylsulfatase A-like enzyme